MNMEKVDKAINKLLSNNVTIRFYMLGSLMKSRILDNVNNKIIVTKGNVGSENRKMQIMKKVLNPLQFTYLGCQGAILSLRRRP